MRQFVLQQWIKNRKEEHDPALLLRAKDFLDKVSREDGEDVINILTVNGDRVSGTERSVSKDDNAIMDFFDMRR